MANQILKTEVVVRGQQAYGVFTIQSEGSNAVYRVDVTNGRCSCPSWKFARPGADGQRAPCKHLRQLGYTENTAH